MGMNGNGGRPFVEARALLLLMLAALATSMMAMVLASPPAQAANLIVSSPGATGAGTLQQRIIQANENPGPDVILFLGLGSSATTIKQSSISQLPPITDPSGLTIDGRNADITVSGPGDASSDQTFIVKGGAKLTIKNLTVTDGIPRPDLSGGAIANNGTLAVDNSTITGNEANLGGGIQNNGTATVSNSTVSGNKASSGGGGIYNAGTLHVDYSTVSKNTATEGGGGIYNAGTLVLFSSTISENTDNSLDGGTASTFGGGGINSATGSTLTVSNSTITGNTAAYSGGAIQSDAAGAKVWNTTIAYNTSKKIAAGLGLRSQEMTLWNTLLAYNNNETSSSIGVSNCSPGSLVINGSSNFDSNEDCNFGTANHSISKTDPELDVLLKDNGGPTQTLALQLGSPAINHGNDAFAVDPYGAANPGGANPLKYDQRGQGFVRIANGAVDIGAYEYQGAVGSEPPPAEEPEDKQACKKGGYEQFGFIKNQGQCIKAVNNAKN
jgi:predicted outer membrane repeat protein